MRLPLYLYSNKNIAGCFTAAVAAGAHLAGLIQDFWWAIVPLSYGVIALAVPGSPQVEVEMEQEMSDSQILDGLSRIAAQAPRALPPEVASDVVDICKMLSTAIPIISKSHASDQIAHDVRQMATDYLPQTIACYTALPPAFRNMKKLQDGKTATQILAEQVGLLKTHLAQVLDGLSSNDVNALLTNGRFLREKFAKPDFINVA
ncbi:MAG TPA: hypothetical protein VKB39_03660 [Candidatus Baltobacteraceae bacterium]|nr:hypothetical protein [Candidatus Baltobacteraceae bacterium]